jgi:hypothetical protein
MRWTMKSDGGQVNLTIGPRRDLFVILFLAWWIALWVVGEVTLISVMAGGLQAVLSGSMPNTISTFRYMWPVISAGLIVWSIIGVAMIYALLWEMLGVETVTLGPDVLLVRRRMVNVSTEKIFPRKAVSEVRLDDRAGWWLSNLEYWGIAGGKLAFESGGKTIRFGRSLDESSAQSIANEISSGKNQQPTA